MCLYTLADYFLCVLGLSWLLLLLQHVKGTAESLAINQEEAIK